MAELKDHQFEIDGYAFGLGLPVLVTDDGFDPGTVGLRTQDQPYPQGDGASFGEDFYDPPTWAWDLGTDQTDTASALKALSDFSRAWRPEKVRRTPGAVCTLRYRVAGRTRRVYGRPRRLAGAPSNRILGGWLPITADFQCADHLTYDDVEQSSEVQVTPSVAGGLTSPLMSPLSTVTTGADSTGGIVVGGDAPTWAVVTFTGPVSAPSVEIAGWHCGITGSLADGESVTIDPRPWARTALRNDGASMAGRLDRETYLDRMQLPPGSHAVVYRGGAETATSTATVRWRSASFAL